MQEYVKKRLPCNIATDKKYSIQYKKINTAGELFILPIDTIKKIDPAIGKEIDGMLYFIKETSDEVKEELKDILIENYIEETVNTSDSKMNFKFLLN